MKGGEASGFSAALLPRRGRRWPSRQRRSDEGGPTRSIPLSTAATAGRKLNLPHPTRLRRATFSRVAGEGVAFVALALLATSAHARPVGCPVKGTGKGNDGLQRMQVEIAQGRPGSTIVCHYYNGRDIILQNDNACTVAPLSRSESSRKTKIDICEAAQPADLAQCTAQCGP